MDSIYNIDGSNLEAVNNNADIKVPDRKGIVHNGYQYYFKRNILFFKTSLILKRSSKKLA